MRRRQGTILSLMRKMADVPIGVRGASSADVAPPSDKSSNKNQPSPKSQPKSTVPAVEPTPEPLPLEDAVIDDEESDEDD